MPGVSTAASAAAPAAAVATKETVPAETLPAETLPAAAARRVPGPAPRVPETAPPGARNRAARSGPVLLFGGIGLAGVTLTAAQLPGPMANLGGLAGAAALFGAALALAAQAVLRARRESHALAVSLAEARRRVAALAEDRGLLARILDELPDAVAVLDDRGRYRYANVAAAARAGRDPVSLTGRGLEETADPPRAARLRALGAAALETGVPQEDFVPMHDEDACAFVTRQVPLVADGALPPAVLLIEHDVTGEVVERERCRDMLDAVVEMILGVIDQRDPYAAYHGWRLGLLAEVVAHELDADPATAETARLAGHLLMAGKALVPASMLSQDLELTPQERAQVQASLDATLEILEEVNFDGPVTRTLCQLQERVDGKGFPLGLPEGRILMSARILKVANAFLGLIDRQPGAPGLALDAALDELWRQAGFAYDARVVEALSRHLGSDEARDAWDPAAEAGSRRRPSA